MYEVLLAGELGFLHFVQTLHTPLLNTVMIKISAVGEEGMVWLVMGMLLLLWRRYRLHGVAILWVLVLTAAVVWVLKDLIARPRPCQLEPLVALLIAAPSNFSCPSGHATAAFSVVPILWSAKRWWGYLATGLALLMGFSRNYLFVHFPSDVLAGAVLGLSAGYLALRFIRK